MTHPSCPDPRSNLSFQSYYAIVHTLHGALPPPRETTPEAFALRDNAAIVQVAALVPVSADEATLGAQYVAALAYASECSRLAWLHVDDPRQFRQLTAQVASMMREARGHRALLQRVQAARVKRESTPEGCDRADWQEHCALGLMTDALVHVSGGAAVAEPVEPAPGEAAPSAVPAAQPPDVAPPPREPPGAESQMPESRQMPGSPALREVPSVADVTPMASEPRDAGRTPSPAGARFVPPPPPPRPYLVRPPSRAAVQDDEPVFDPVAEAERYALIYPRRAQLIRRLGGLPVSCSFGPPEPELVAAIVRGTSPALLALDGPEDAT